VAINDCVGDLGFTRRCKSASTRGPRRGISYRPLDRGTLMRELLYEQPIDKCSAEETRPHLDRVPLD